MANREEKRNLETIPVGSLGIISLPGCKPLGEKVDQYLVKWRAERESEHKESLAFAGYQRESYLLDAKVPRFGSGDLLVQNYLAGKFIVLVNEVRFDGGVVRVFRGDMLERCHTVHPELSRR